MTAPAIMRRGVLLFALGCAMLAACATTQTKDEATRDAIHEHLSSCNHRVDQYNALHSGGTWMAIQCELWAERECTEAGLERRCAQWQWGDSHGGAWR